jgi:hypothetical protein
MTGVVPEETLTVKTDARAATSAHVFFIESHARLRNV